MTPLLLSLTLTAPAHPPGYVPPPLPPRVVVQPQFVPVPAYRPPAFGGPVFPGYPPPPVVVQPVPPPALTLADFSRAFAPTPGKHAVWIVHPVTRQPVHVCFVLPEGKLREFEVDRRTIRFEFRGGYEVEIEFRSNGTVRVEYDG